MRTYALGAIILSGLFSLFLNSCNKDEEYSYVQGGDDSTSTVVSDFEVVEYRPAPGQFINDPATGGDGIKSENEAIRFAQGKINTNDFLSLGAFGGYVVVRSKAPISNSGDYDFAIGGNSFDTSNEPGIVWVMRDTDGNGLPDDVWYELKGSDFYSKDYRRGYSVTYLRPAPGCNTQWEDNEGNSGFVAYVGSFHSQPFYYPEWIESDSYTLSGSRLSPLTRQDVTTGEWINPPFKWGYADNNGEDSVLESVNGKTIQKNCFRISDAVDAYGNPVSLESVDFIKVQSAVNGSSGWLGEISTEITGFFLVK